MKKLITMILLSAMLLSFASCNSTCNREDCTCNMEETSSSSTATTETTEHMQTTDTSTTNDTTETSNTEEIIVPEIFFDVPADEKEITKTIVTENADGMKMELTLHGYASESLEKNFYVKHNEVIRIDAKIVNGSEKTYHQFLPTYCRHSSLGDYPHNHEIAVDIANARENPLTSLAVYGGCPEMWEVWDIEAGKTYDFCLEYVAGKPYYTENGEELYDIPLYGNEIYPDGICDFTGTISFSYYDENEKANDLVLSSDIVLEIVYVR